MGTTLDNDALMKAATFDYMDMIHSPIDGKLVVVAVHHGVHVCQQCGDPFDDNDPRYRLVEKKNDIDASVPVGVHRKCVNPKVQVSVGTTLRKIAAGMRAKMQAVRALAFDEHLAKVAGEKKIVL